MNMSGSVTITVGQFASAIKFACPGFAQVDGFLFTLRIHAPSITGRPAPSKNPGADPEFFAYLTAQILRATCFSGLPESLVDLCGTLWREAPKHTNQADGLMMS